MVARSVSVAVSLRTLGKESPRKKQELVILYGFDKAGLSIPPAVDRPEYRIEGLPYGSPEIPANTKGLILASGIFEHVQYTTGYMGRRAASVTCDRENLLIVDRHVTNVLKSGGWIVILVREIVDEFPSGDGYNGTFVADDTDLAKRILTGIQRRRYSEGTGSVAPKRDEFGAYIKRWGIAKTLFGNPEGARVLAVAGEQVVGFEYGARVYVLPFMATSTSSEHAKELGETLVRGVLDYRRKMLVHLPDWVGDFQFVGEAELRREQSVLRERLLEVDSGLETWEKNKIVLVSSGTILKDALVEILKTFFGFSVDTLDEGRDDFKIIDDARAPIVIGEVKGTNGGVKREHINQVDSHRERLGLGADVPGLLVINNQMDITGIAKRHEAQVAQEQVRHARHHNVLVVRTIDLVYLMRHLEVDLERREKFLGLLRGRGGWLSAGPSGYEVVTGAPPA